MSESRLHLVLRPSGNYWRDARPAVHTSAPLEADTETDVLIVGVGLAGLVTAWFTPDTAFSLWSGFWQNAVLNVAVATLFAVPLAATYRTFHASSD